MRTAFLRIVPVAVLGLGTGLLFAQGFRTEEVGKSPVETKFVSGGEVRAELCSSGVDLVGGEQNAIHVSYFPEREDVRVRIEVDGDRADLKVSHCPNNNFRIRIEVPKSSGVHVRMFAGQLELRGVKGDKDVEMSAGQLTMEVGNPDDYGRVYASVSSGDLHAPAFDVQKGGLFRSFDRTGPGKYRLNAHVGAGQLDLR